jgi:predicted PurR-regulated permease PerM
MADERQVRSGETVAPVASPVFTAGSIFLALAALYFGRDIFVPFALAILLAFALAPLVDWLRRFRVPRIAAVLMAVSLAVVIIGGVSLVVGGQLVELAASMPSYKQTIATKLRSLRLGQGALEQVTHTVEDLSRELTDDQSGSAPQSAAPTTGGEQRRPVPVVIEQPEMRPLEVLRTIAGPLIAPLATAGIVIVFVIFVLIERTDLRDRFIRLVGHGDLQKSTRVLNDAAERVSR